MKVSTQRILGTTICSRSVKHEISHFSKNSSDLFTDVVKDAIENNYRIYSPISRAIFATK